MSEESRRRSVDDENAWPLIDDAIDVIIEADPTKCPECHGTRQELSGTSHYGIHETVACTACYGPAYEIAMELYRVGMLGPKPWAAQDFSLMNWVEIGHTT